MMLGSFKFCRKKDALHFAARIGPPDAALLVGSSTRCVVFVAADNEPFHQGHLIRLITISHVTTANTT